MTIKEAIICLKGIKNVGHDMFTEQKDFLESLDIAIKALENEAILYKIKEQILDEANFAYADFDRYKEDILDAEPDELPNDDFRYGMHRAFDIINKHQSKRKR